MILNLSPHFEVRPAIAMVHRQNKNVLDRFAEADEEFAIAKLNSSGGHPFETAVEAEREERHRIRMLMSRGFKRTARELSLGWEREGFAASFASAIFSRNFRMRVAKRFMKLAGEFDPDTYLRLHIVSARWRVRGDMFDADFLASIKKRARRVLDDAGMTSLSGIAIGQVDVSFDGKLFCAHFHLAIAGNKHLAIPALREIMNRHKGNGVNNPLRVDKMTQLGGGLSYCMKSFPKKRAPECEAKSYGVRLGVADEALWLMIMHKVRVSDVVLLQGLRLGRRGLARIKPRGRT